MSTIRKKDIKLGKKDILASDEFDSKYGKERITILLDQQVVDFFRNMSTPDKGYQTLIREALRNYVFKPQDDLSSRLERIEQVLFKKV